MTDRLYFKQIPIKSVENTEPVEDKINHPNHYTFGNIETIDFIKDKLTNEQYIGYCLGNVMKYISRYRLKGGLDDLEKAMVYLGWAIEAYRGDAA